MKRRLAACSPICCGRCGSVPRGKVATYGDIAYAAGYPGAARQVAWALHAESAGLPWHRIVGAGGTILLTGEHGFEQRMRLQSGRRGIFGAEGEYGGAPAFVFCRGGGGGWAEVR